MSLIVLLLFMGLVLPATGQDPAADADAARSRSVTMPSTADPPGPPLRRLKQLTGKRNRPGQRLEPDLADPSPPQALPDGRIRITGTGCHAGCDRSVDPDPTAAVWSSWDAFLGGEDCARERMELYRVEVGRLIRLSPEETPWDVTIETWSGQEVLWGGTLTPVSGAQHAVMWDENWTRRVWPFLRDPVGRWIRGPHPLFGPPPEGGLPTHLDHSYGHQFIRDEAGAVWVFYERVSRTRGVAPALTEIYARRMVSATRASADERYILGPGDPPPPTAQRENGETLIEGPRPVRILLDGRPFYLLGFSAGDFRAPTYGLHFAVSRDLLGPYAVYRTADGEDLADLGHEIRRRYDLSWGPGRPALFQDPGGRLWLLFHATAPSVLGDFRNIYLAPVDVTLGQDGWPRLTLRDDNADGAAAVPLAHPARRAR